MRDQSVAVQVPPESLWRMPLRWLVPAVGLLLLAWVLPLPEKVLTPLRFLAAHNYLEGVAVVISLLVFAFGWSTFSASQPRGLTYIAVGFLAVGLLDIAHVLSYAGMPEFISANSPNKGIYFWLAARFTAAATLLAAILALPAPLSRSGWRHGLVMAALLWVAACHVLVLGDLDALPLMFVDGQGVTPLKVAAEYLIILLHLGSIVLLLRRRGQTRLGGEPDLLAALCFMALAELTFTLYVRVYDTFNLLGHVYKFAAYYFIYRSVFQAGVVRPIDDLKRSEARLKVSEARSRMLLNSLAEGVVLHDASGAIISHNPAAERILGLSGEQIRGKTSLDPQWQTIRPDGTHFPGSEHPASVTLRTGQAQRNVEMGVYRGDGQLVWISISSEPVIQDGQASSDAVVVSFVDITERRQADEALRESQERLRAITENSGNIIYIKDLQGRYIFINRLYERIFNVTNEGMRGVTDFAVFPHEVADHFNANDQKAISRGEPIEVEESVSQEDGVHTYLTVKFPLRKPNGKIFALCGISTDITERKRVEERLAEQQALLRSLIDSIPDLIFFKDRNSVYLGCNRAFEVYAGMSEAQLIGKSDYDLTSRETAEAYRQKDRMALDANQPCRNEEWIPYARGGGGYFDTLKTPYYSPRGEVLGLIGVSRDITARRQAEQSLAESEARFRTIIEATPVPLAINDDHGNITYLNRSFLQTLGYGLDEIPTLAEWWPRAYPDPLYREWVAGEWQRHVEDAREKGGEFPPMEVEIHCKDGLTRSFMVGSSPLREGQAGSSLVMLYDITERKRAEVEIRKWADAFNHCAHGIAMGDPDTNTVIVCNPAFAQMRRCGVDEVRGMAIRELYAPDEYDNLKRWIAESDITGRVHYESRMLRQDGTLFPVQVDLVNVHDANGRSMYRVATIQDITERRQGEEVREQLQRQLQQTQKLETIGQLTGGIAHDFNNILGAILGYTTLAHSRYGTELPEKVNDYLAEVIRAGERARDLIAKMLAFARGSKGESQVLEPAPLVKEVVKMLGSTLPSSIDLDMEIEGTPAVRVDAVQLHQAITNLIVNARDALPGKGRIRVGLRMSDGRGEECSACHKLVEGRYVELMVTDNGAGIAPEVLPRIFDPFFTTKEVGKGSGMGLPMVLGIVREHGGHILVESRPGGGSTFRLLFPPADAVAMPAAAPEDAGRMQAGHDSGRRVLVVDDEAPLARLMGEVLDGYGYQTSVYSDPGQALEAFLAAPEAFDALITDQTMPGLTGVDLARAVLEKRPGLLVIMCSGYSDQVDADSASQYGIRHFFNKPVRAESLVEVLQDSLQGNQGSHHS